MKHNPEKELLVLVILGLVGLIFLWLLIPVPVAMFNHPPLFLISYLLAIFLPGYTLLSFVKPEMSIRSRLEVGVPLSLGFMFLVTFLFIFLGIPLALTYAVSVLMILSLVMAFSTYLAEKMGPKGRAPPTPEPPLKEETAPLEAPVEMEKTIITRPVHTQTKLIPPTGEVEVIIPNHKGENTTQEASNEKSGLKLPWIERQKELDQQKK